MNTVTVLILLAIGLFAGIFGGMVGLGGGVIMIPAMIYFLGVSQQSAQGTSLAVMLPPVGLMAVMNYYKAGQMNFKYAAIIAIAFFVGGYFGSKIALNISPDKMKKVFAIALMLIAINMLIKK
ncbi:MAG: sulfite exporter TauE/SafE family protein [Bacteroidetes bacterium]|nr:sulfite exporter TauE/SafE family protein [Bacteroidota bacterium]